MMSDKFSNIADELDIQISGVWKIFGQNPNEALKAIHDRGLSKSEVLEEFNCVVGVSDASFEVRRGEIFCVMGLSGSGKSTLVRHINRLLTPTAGNIYVRGVDVMAMNENKLRDLRNNRIAMVFQDFGLMPHRSVRDNVAMALEIRGLGQNARWEAAEKALALVELSDWKDKYAHELSGGMQQRVGLARAIAADADVLLMDEPFSALDPLIRRQLQTEFMSLAAKMKKTTVFITHDLEEAVRIGDRIAIMRDGVIVQIGTAQDIVTNPADDYVSDFVAGISRLSLIQAQGIMQTQEQYIQEHGAIADDAPRHYIDTPLSELIRSSVKRNSPVLVTNDQNNIVGVVGKSDLLRGVIAGTES